jgi:hypothetical protein
MTRLFYGCAGKRGNQLAVVAQAMHKFRYPNLVEAAQVGENGRELAGGTPGPGPAAVD